MMDTINPVLPFVRRDVRTDDDVRCGDMVTAHRQPNGSLVYRRTEPGETIHTVAASDSHLGSVKVLGETALRHEDV